MQENGQICVIAKQCVFLMWLSKYSSTDSTTNSASDLLAQKSSLAAEVPFHALNKGGKTPS